MSYVAIYKTNKDIEKKDKIQKLLPDDYPAMCEEFMHESEARRKYPQATIMTSQAYNEYMNLMSQLYDTAKADAEKPWWKIW